VNVVASLSSSLIPQTTNAFDLGSATKIWRDLYISTGSIKFVAGTTVVKELTLSTLTALETATGSSNVSITNLNSFSSSQLTKDATLATLTGSYDTRFATLATYTGSVDTRFTTLGTLTGSNAIRLTNLESTTASLNISVTNLNTFSGSENTKAATLATYTGSVDTRFTTLATTTGSINTSVSNLNTFSGSALTRLTALEVETSNLETFTASMSTTSNVRFGSLGIGMAASGTSGRIDASNDIVAFSTSDIRLKENITPIANAIEKIRKISGNTYDWKAELKDVHGYEGNDVGVIAQEVEAVLPQLVQDRDNGYKAVKYDKIVALLIEGIKEQQQHIDNLTIQVEELKKQKGL
jgi:spore maturation protein SpmB